MEMTSDFNFGMHIYVSMLNWTLDIMANLFCHTTAFAYQAVVCDTALGQVQ